MRGKPGPRPDVTKKPEQPSLNGMEDREIKPLQDAAREYAEIRDQRQQLTAKEVELKSKVLSLMKRHKRDHYEFDGVEIELVTESETVKVRIRKPQEVED